MTDKVTLSNVVTFQNDTTAATTVNNNNAAITTAMDNTLSRDGTAPNQMLASLDMNSFQILNLPAPTSPNSPARLTDVTNTVTPTNLLGGNNIWTGTNNFNVGTSFNNTVNMASSLNVTGTATVGGIVSTTFNAGTVTGTHVTGITDITTKILKLNGATSGTTIFQPQASAGGTITVPATTATLLSSGGSVSQGTHTNPAGTSSTIGVMQGLGNGFFMTPAFSTRMYVAISGQATNSAANGGATISLRYGTGAGPANGVSQTGTVIANQFILNNSQTASALFPFTVCGVAFSLVPNTIYWVDLGLAVITAGTASIVNPSIVAFEM